MPEVSKILVYFKKEKRKSPAKIQKALVLKADILRPCGSFTYLPLAGLPGMPATKLTGLGQRDKCEIFWK